MRLPRKGDKIEVTDKEGATSYEMVLQANLLPARTRSVIRILIDSSRGFLEDHQYRIRLPWGESIGSYVAEMTRIGHSDFRRVVLISLSCEG